MTKSPIHFVILHLIANNDRNGNGRRCWLVLDVATEYATPVYCTADDSTGNAAYDIASWITGDGTRYLTSANVERIMSHTERQAWTRRVQTIETTPGTVARWVKWQKRRDTEAADDAKQAAKEAAKLAKEAAALASVGAAILADTRKLRARTMGGAS